MAFDLVIKPIVFLDIDDAVDYYEEQSKGLGKRFYNHFLISLQNIQKQPHKYSFICHSVCRCMVDKFPYKILYLVVEEKIFHFAVAHAKRSNVFIRKRLR